MDLHDRPAGAQPHPDRMWLAHHGPDHAERCLHLHGVAVCRRCAVLYPVAVLTAIVVVVVAPRPGLLVAAMWLLPAPMVLEWVGEHLGALTYSPRRQVALTALGAPALGIALALHALEPWTLAAAAPIVSWTVVCVAAAAWSWWRRTPQESPGWEARHLEQEAERRAHLERLLADADAACSAVAEDLPAS